MQFDRIVIVDWSAAGRPTLGKDSIWFGVTDNSGTTAWNCPTRAQAMGHLLDHCRTAAAQHSRLLIGVDFGLGYPAGFVAEITGQPLALSFWDWLDRHITDGPDNASNYRDVAAMINRAHASQEAEIGAGLGPFWGNGRKAETPDLPRKKPDLPSGLAPQRATERAGRHGGGSPKSMFQLAYTGAVGAQSLTGIPILQRLRHAIPQVRVWPFQDCGAAPIVVAEVYPSLLRDALRADTDAGPTPKTRQVPDEAQVRALSKTLFTLSQANDLSGLFQPDAPPETLQEEGWILGAGHAEALMRAAGQAVSGTTDQTVSRRNV